MTFETECSRGRSKMIAPFFYVGLVRGPGLTCATTAVFQGSDFDQRWPVLVPRRRLRRSRASAPAGAAVNSQGRAPTRRELVPLAIHGRPCRGYCLPSQEQNRDLFRQPDPTYVEHVRPGLDLSAREIVVRFRFDD